MTKILLSLLVLLMVFNAAAQRSEPQFEHINVENGLPNAHVTKCLQDKAGYIWIGTENGLVRYDGYEKKVYRLETGKPQHLSSLNIQELYEDPQGNLWIGTFYDGFFKYNRDTDNFTQYKKNSRKKVSLATNDVHNIISDGQGNLYIYSYDHPKNLGHINRFNVASQEYKVFSPGAKNPADRIPALDNFVNWFKDQNGSIVLPTTNGLYTFDKKLDRFVGLLTEADSTRRHVIGRFYQSPSRPNIFYFADLDYQLNLRAIMRFDSQTKTFSQISYPGLNPGEKLVVNSFFEDKAGKIWLATSRGISGFDERTKQMKHYPLTRQFNGVNRSEVYIITEDETGMKWVAVANGAMNFNAQTGTFSPIYADAVDEMNPTRMYYFTAAFQDRSGNLWLRDREAVHRLQKEYSLFDIYKRSLKDSSGYQGSYFYNIIPLAKNSYLLPGVKGIYTWNTETDRFERHSLPGTFGPRDIFLKATVDLSGHLWGGVVDANYQFKGLYKYDLQRKVAKLYKSNPADSTTPSSDFISTVFADSKNNVWIGTFNKGLVRYIRETDQFKRYPFVFRETKKPVGELDDLTVNVIYEDKKGTIWIGTVNGGLNRYDPASDRFTSYFDAAKGFRQIVCMLEDKKGRFWVGSELSGLFLFDRKSGKMQLFSEKEGLLSNGVVGISEDVNGNLWISTTRGLSKFNPDTRTFRNFTKEHGLPDSRLSYATRTLDDGRILISSYSGFMVFDPARIKPNHIPPQVHIRSVAFPTSVDRQGKFSETILPVSGKKELQLTHDQNRLRFDYVGLHFKNPSQNQYRYQLEGYDKDWVNAGNQHSAVYTNLSPGDYIFKVKASNSDGVWSKEEARIAFTITPPWWQTWWAYILYALVFAIALRSYIVLRSRALIRENQLLEERISRRTQELSDANKALNSQRDQLAATVGELKSTQQQLIQSEKLASLGELTAGIAHEIQNPLNFVNNFSEVSIELAEDMEGELKNGDTSEALAIAEDIKLNLQKIMHHGQRAGGIVKSMLQHSRKASGEKDAVDINEFVNEYIKLSYHGLRAKYPTFEARIVTDLQPDLPKVELIREDIGRVLINLLNNAFYAVQQRKSKENETYTPELKVSTFLQEKLVCIRIRDNGTGIPDKIRDKILQPFFTTKPTGEGTGLGLSLSFDIVRAHGGKLDIESREGEFSEFSVLLPLL